MFTYEVAASHEPGEYRHGVSADEFASTLIMIEESETAGAANYSIADLSVPATAEPSEGITVSVVSTISHLLPSPLRASSRSRR